MPFDLATFEAEIALSLIPTEQLPRVAQDAMEQGFDGPGVLRMAILEPDAGWAIDQALQPMLAELGCQAISPQQAALSLALQLARRILDSGEDPLPSIPYFYRLMLAADYPSELVALGYFDDLFFEDETEEEEKKTLAREALEELLSPELREQRVAERKAAWELKQAKVKSEWPYILNSPTGRALFKARYKEKLAEMRPVLWIEAVAWIAVGWAFSSWRTSVTGFVTTMPILFALAAWAEYRRMKRERRDLLLRLRVPEDQI
ncbi:hypothetical protein [Granulicella paludicola]|uniref:hypothetical protein n=1 Tax=Granulicella paludicola TaxID=474951 RepID=UPI0021DFA637|nr:hypothetical protein [Granulicella paludicola]